MIRLLILVVVTAVGILDGPRHRETTTRYDEYFRKFSKRYFGPGFA